MIKKRTAVARAGLACAANAVGAARTADGRTEKRTVSSSAGPCAKSDDIRSRLFFPTVPRRPSFNSFRRHHSESTASVRSEAPTGATRCTRKVWRAWCRSPQTATRNCAPPLPPCLPCWCREQWQQPRRGEPPRRAGGGHGGATRSTKAVDDRDFWNGDTGADAARAVAPFDARAPRVRRP